MDRRGVGQVPGIEHQVTGEQVGERNLLTEVVLVAGDAWDGHASGRVGVAGQPGAVEGVRSYRPPDVGIATLRERNLDGARGRGGRGEVVLGPHAAVGLDEALPGRVVGGGAASANGLERPEHLLAEPRKLGSDRIGRGLQLALLRLQLSGDVLLPGDGGCPRAAQLHQRVACLLRLADG